MLAKDGVERRDKFMMLFQVPQTMRAPIRENIQKPILRYGRTPFPSVGSWNKFKLLSELEKNPAEFQTWQLRINTPKLI